MTLDKRSRIDLIVMIYAIAYMSFVILHKGSMLVADEIFNCILFTSFDIRLKEMLRNARLENLRNRLKCDTMIDIDYFKKYNIHMDIY